MVDQVDQANGIAEQHAQRSIDIARAKAALPNAEPGTCEMCCEEDVMVRGVGGLRRCTPCRAKWEKRR